MFEINYCPGTLAKGFNTYSRSCLNRMFNGKKVSHILQYTSPDKSESVYENFLENRTRISISGVQEKVSMLLDKNILRLTNKGEQGTYILKPIPHDLKKASQVPANEHLTMQIARQVYKIHTAENALIFFKNGEPAYITKRFDIINDSTKAGKEDFASLAGKTKDNGGTDYKYEYSYEETGDLIRRFIPVYKIEIEKFFRIVIFNFLFSNGDAHLKNFSAIESLSGDYILSPAYDLVNTGLHINDSDFALKKGLFADNYKSDIFKKTNHPCIKDFLEFARRLGIDNTSAAIITEPFLRYQIKVEELISNSFLDIQCKKTYLQSYRTRLNYLSDK